MFKPVKNKVLVQIAEVKSESGLVLPESMEGHWTAIVIATNVLNDNVFELDSKILMPKNCGQEIKISGDNYRLVPETNIYGTLQ